MSDDLRYDVAINVKGEKDAERLVKTFESMDKAFSSARGSGKALEEVRRIIVGLGNQAPIFKQLADEVRGLNSAANSLKGMGEHMSRTLKSEFNQTRATLATGFQELAELTTQILDKGIKQGTDRAAQTLEEQTRRLAARAKAAANKAYAELAGNNYNARLSDTNMQGLSELRTAGATLSPLHAGQLKAWLASNMVELRPTITKSARESAAVFSSAFDSELARSKQTLGDFSKRMGLDSSYVAKSAKDSASVFTAAFASENAAAQQAFANYFRNMTAVSGKSAKESAAVFATNFAREDKYAADAFNAYFKRMTAVSGKSAKESASVFSAAFAEESGRARQAFENYFSGLTDVARKSAKESAAVFTATFAAESARARQSFQNFTAGLGGDSGKSAKASASAFTASENQPTFAKLVTEGYSAWRLAAVAAADADGKVRVGMGLTNKQAFELHSGVRGLAAGFNALWLTWGAVAPLLTGAAISYGIRSVVEMGAKVDNTMQTIRVLSEESAESVGKLNTQMLELARSGPFGPQAVADAMKTLSLAGQSAVEVGLSIRDVLNFSVAGDTSIEKAADVLTSVATAFGIGAEGFNIVGDTIAKTAAVSKSSVESIGEAFKSSSVVAKQYGVSLVDVGTNLAALSNLGIQGSAAGTAMRNMYNDLSGRTPKVVKALKEIGLSVKDLKDESTGGFKDIVTMAQTLQGAMDTLKTPIDRQRALMAILSERGAKPLIELLDLAQRKAKDAGTSMATALEELRYKIEENAGFAGRAAAEMAITPLNQMKSVSATLQASLVETFQGLQPTILEVSAKLKDIFNSKEFKDGMANLLTIVANLSVLLVEHADKVVMIGAAYVSFKAATLIVGGLSTAFLGLNSAINGVATVMSGTVTASSLLLRFMGPIGVAVGTAATAWSLYSFFQGQAKRTSDDMAQSNNLRTIGENLDAESKRLRENAQAIRDRTQALKENITIEEIKARRDGLEQMGAAQNLLSDRNNSVQDAQRNLDNFNFANPERGASQGAVLLGGSLKVERERARLRKEVEDRRSLIKEAEDSVRKLEASQANHTNAAKEVADAQKVFDAEYAKRNKKHNPNGTDFELPGPAGFGGGRKFLDLEKDGSLESLRKQQTSATNILKDSYKEQQEDFKLLKDMQLLSEGDYYRKALELASNYDTGVTALIKAQKVEYENAANDRIKSLESRLGDPKTAGAVQQAIEQAKNQLQAGLASFDEQLADGGLSRTKDMIQSMGRDARSLLQNLARDSKFWRDQEAVTNSKAAQLDSNERYLDMASPVFNQTGANRARDNAIAASTEETRKQIQALIESRQQITSIQEGLTSTLADLSIKIAGSESSEAIADLRSQVAEVEKQLRNVNQMGSNFDDRIGDARTRQNGRAALAGQNAYREALNGSRMDLARKDPLTGLGDAMQVSMNNVMDSASRMQTMYTSAIDGMSSSLTNFVQTGKFSVKDFATSFTATMIEMATKLLANRLLLSIFGAFMPAFGASAGVGAGTTMSIGGGMPAPTAFAAKGGVWNSPSLSAYSSGVYNSPQPFAFEQPRMFAKGGIFAEAGPEAIMPLAKGSDGELGVKVKGDAQGGPPININIDVQNNVANAQPSFTAERSQNGDILIKAVINEVANGIRTGTGPVNSALNGRYALEKR